MAMNIRRRPKLMARLLPTTHIAHIRRNSSYNHPSGSRGSASNNIGSMNENPIGSIIARCNERRLGGRGRSCTSHRFTLVSDPARRT